MSGPDDEEELPWPAPDPPDTPAGGDDPRREAAEDGEAATRRGRGAEPRPGAPPGGSSPVGGALLVLVLAFVLWYELEAHALGPEGRQVVVTVAGRIGRLRHLRC